MATANEKIATDWRNFVVWSVLGAIGYLFAVWGGISIVHDEGFRATMRELPRSNEMAAVLGLGLVFSSVLVGFTSRKRPFSGRTFRNFVIRDVTAISACLLVLWGFSTLAAVGALGTMGASEWAAAVAGSAIAVVALLGILATASARISADLIDDEMAAEDMRERSRLLVYSFLWMIACGLLLVGLSLAGPGGVLPLVAALPAAAALLVALAVLGAATWRMSDELGRTLSYETGNMAFYLIFAIGGGWAMLSHLGLLAAPSALDWVTLFTMLMFVAAVVVLGRRKLLRT